MSDPAVLDIQRRLQAAGYDPGPLDGIMGPKTQAAMRASGMALPAPTGNAHSADWSDADIATIAGIFHTLRTTPDAVFPVIMYESNAEPWRQNPSPERATGLLQWIRSNTASYGYTPEEFAKLSIGEQLPFVLRYLSPHTGKLVNSTAVYMALFQPAFIDHAGDPTWTHPTWNRDYVYAPGTAPGSIVPGSGGSPGNVYNRNPGFDRVGRGYIVIGDLRDVADSQLYLPRTQELIARTRRAMGLEASVAKGIGIAGVGLIVGLGTLAWYLAKRWA